MQNNSIQSLALLTLNLSANEKQVIATIRELKIAQTAAKIAEKAGIPRTTAIYILEKFQKWKIVKKIRVNKKYYWIIEKF